MKRSFPFVIGLGFFGLVLVSGCGESPPPDDQLARISGQIADNFMKELKGELYKAMEDSGAVGAVYVCAEKGPEISARYSSLPGLTVRRASTMNRNPQNAPLPFEQTALETLAKRPAAAGDDYFVWDQDDGGKVFRFIRAIRTAPPCLNCHGEDAKLAPGIKEALAEKYPDDKATGFKIGDLRGVMTVSMKWPESKPVVDSLLAGK